MAAKALGPATLAAVQAVTALARGPMVVAVSGGADSMALAACAKLVGERQSLFVRAITVDHGLQPGSNAVARQAAGRLESLGVPAEVVRVDVREHGEGLEAAARAARYAALESGALPGEAVLLGHTLDDQAETVLLGLARGSGTRSLAGMPASRGIFRRPFLGLRRSQTRQVCVELGLDWWDDPQNADPRFTRVRVRDSVLPVLEAELGPGVADSLARTAQLASADADLLDALAAAETSRMSGSEIAEPSCPSGSEAGPMDAVVPEPTRSDGQPHCATSESWSPDCATLAALHPALRLRVLRDWLRAHGADELHAVHLRSVDALVTDWHGQKWVEVPGLRVTRRDGRLWIS